MRAALYVRVSSKEQVQGYSLDAQTRAIESYCTQHDYEVVARYRDEARSARTDNLTMRPAFQQMLEDAEAGRFDVLVVHKLDRFARNILVALETLQRLERLDVGFVSISEQMDFATPIGKVMLTMLVGLGQFYSDNLAFETKKGKAERKRQGLYNGLLPFGLKKGEGGLPFPDPETYPGLLLALQLGAEGKSDRAVAEAHNAAGYRTTGNRGRNPFTKDTVCRLLQNRFYLGELPDGNGGWIPGAHQAVLDPELFAAAQRGRAGNWSNSARVNRRHRRYALSGLAVCAGCGGRLHFHTSKGGRARIFSYRERQAAPVASARHSWTGSKTRCQHSWPRSQSRRKRSWSWRPATISSHMSATKPNRNGEHSALGWSGSRNSPSGRPDAGTVPS
jgi:site-specific DNA recombinase